MRTCIYCGAELPGQAGFCGNCGQPTPPAGNPVESPTNGKSGSGNQLLQIHSLDAATMISTPQWGNAVQGQPGQAYDSHSSQFAGDFGTQPSADDEEEKRRRKAAMLGFGLLGLAGEGQPPAGITRTSMAARLHGL